MKQLKSALLKRLFLETLIVIGIVAAIGALFFAVELAQCLSVTVDL